MSTYRLWGEFHLSSLGSDWQKTLSGWKEDVRAEFVSDLIHLGNAAHTLAGFALADTSLKVRLATISALAWINSREDTAQMLESLDNATFEEAVQGLPTEFIPFSMRDRAIAVNQKLFANSSDRVQRLQLLMRIAELGGTSVRAQLKRELSECEREMLEGLSQFALKPVLDLVRSTEPDWVSHWVAYRISEGMLHDHWISFVTSVPDELRERLLHRLETEDLTKIRRPGASISVLAACADSALVQHIFRRLCEFKQVISSAPNERHELEWAIQRQLEDLLHAFPANVVMEGVLACFSTTADPTQLTAVSRLFSRVGRWEESDFRSKLRSDLRQSLRSYFRNGVPEMLHLEDFSGEQKADLASALSQVGEPEDMTILRELIQADVERVRRGRDAYARGDRGRLGNGGVVSYANWHVRAAVRLDPDTADAVLLDVLKEPEYERDAAGALIQLASASKVEPGFGKKKDYREVWEARAGLIPNAFNEDRRKHYAVAIRERVTNILEEGARTEETADYRLKELTKTLAAIDSAGSTSLIFRALAVPGRFNGWAIVEALDALLFNGVRLPTAETLELFDSIQAEVRPHFYNEQQVGLLVRALCLLPFLDDARKGIQKIREVVADLRIRSYQLRDVVTALGHSRCDEAIGVLLELACDEANTKAIEDAWINAVAALDSPEARRLLMSFVDPEAHGLPFEMKFAREDIIAARLVELARHDTHSEQRLLQLCAMRDLPPPKRSLLGRVVSLLGTSEAALASLNSINDRGTPSVPYETWKQIESIFVEHKPVGSDTNSYTLAPRSSNEVRARLFEMATKDKDRMKTASLLLGQIEVWRLEYGRPNGEPRNPDRDCSSSWPPLAEAKEDAAQVG